MSVALPWWLIPRIGSKRVTGRHPSGWIPGVAFELHPKLAAGGFEMGRLGSCRLLLKNNALFPWLILVPEVEDIEDLHELPLVQFEEVMASTRKVSEFVAHYFQPEKLNVACIGNVVRQMHIHIVGRFTGDPAWPGTVWAHEERQLYDEQTSKAIQMAAIPFFGLS